MELPIRSEITAVTVFFAGAEITRRATVKLNPGKNDLFLGFLPDSVQPGSVTLRVEGARLTGSSGYRVDTLSTQPNTAETEQLVSRLEEVKDALFLLKEKDAALRTERDIIIKDCKLESQNDISLSVIRSVVEYYRERSSVISSDLLSVARKIEKLEKEQERLQERIGSAVEERTVGSLPFSVYAETECEAIVLLTYTDSAAGWRAFYELRAESVESDAVLTLRGEIWQRTGENWDEIPMTLSTGNPYETIDCPTLSPWKLTRYPEKRAPLTTLNSPKNVVCYSLCEDSEMLGKEASVSSNGASLEFALPSPLTVASGHTEQIAVSETEMKMSCRYTAVRKVDRRVFLTAEISGWQSLDLLEAEADVFFGGSYVGKLNLNPDEAEETMPVSFGCDSQVFVTRIKGSDRTEKKLFGNTIKSTIEWIITARNCKKETVCLKMLDQIPVSADGEITVDALELSEGSHNEKTGEVSWDLTIPSGGSVQKVLRYQVSYPKGAVLPLE